MEFGAWPKAYQEKTSLKFRLQCIILPKMQLFYCWPVVALVLHCRGALSAVPSRARGPAPLTNSGRLMLSRVLVLDKGPSRYERMLLSPHCWSLLESGAAWFPLWRERTNDEEICHSKKIKCYNISIPFIMETISSRTLAISSVRIFKGINRRHAPQVTRKWRSWESSPSIMATCTGFFPVIIKRLVSDGFAYYIRWDDWSHFPHRSCISPTFS